MTVYFLPGFFKDLNLSSPCHQRKGWGEVLLEAFGGPLFSQASAARWLRSAHLRLRRQAVAR